MKGNHHVSSNNQETRHKDVKQQRSVNLNDRSADRLLKEIQDQVQEERNKIAETINSPRIKPSPTQEPKDRSSTPTGILSSPYNQTQNNNNSYRNFIKDRFSPKSRELKSKEHSDGITKLTTAEIQEKIKKEIELNSRTTQQLNLLMNKTMKWVTAQDFKKYRVGDIQEYRNDPLTIQIGH